MKVFCIPIPYISLPSPITTSKQEDQNTLDSDAED